jgi:hypothetical protein
MESVEILFLATHVIRSRRSYEVGSGSHDEGVPAGVEGAREAFSGLGILSNLDVPSGVQSMHVFQDGSEAKGPE